MLKMGLSSDFETFEKEFIELVSEFNSLRSSETRLREVVRTESARAEAAEVAKKAAERAAADARAGAAAATSAAAHSTQLLSSTQDKNIALEIKLELTEHQHHLLEEKCAELLNQVATLDKEVQLLRPIQLAHSSLKNQYVELLDRINAATEEARSESSRLEDELRRVEKCAGAGTEMRERARLAAAAHARERRLAAAELQHTTQELHTANVEITRLSSLVSELKYRLEQNDIMKSKAKAKDPVQETLVELRASLEAEQAGAARLERSLAAALSDNATLASKLYSSDNTSVDPPASSDSNCVTNICPIDAFLEDC